MRSNRISGKASFSMPFMTEQAPASKDARTELHKAIRTIYPELDSRTVNSDTRQIIVVNRGMNLLLFFPRTVNFSDCAHSKQASHISFTEKPSILSFCSVQRR